MISMSAGLEPEKLSLTTFYNMITPFFKVCGIQVFTVRLQSIANKPSYIQVFLLLAVSKNILFQVIVVNKQNAGT